VEIVLLLALLPCPLVVIFFLQVPDGWPPVLLEILLVFWGHGLHVSGELAAHVVVVGADVVKTPVSQLVRAVELSQF